MFSKFLLSSETQPPLLSCSAFVVEMHCDGSTEAGVKFNVLR